jgi:phage terminase large subunit-like protein
MNKAEVMAQAADAARMPSRQPDFENLILNRRVEAMAPFISGPLWATCAAIPAPLAEGAEVYGGLDLSAVNDLTALVLGERREDVWQVHPTFWLPGDALAAKSRSDRVPYDVWHRQGYLEAAPGRSVDYEYVAEYLREVFRLYDVQKIGFDAWGWDHLRPKLLEAGFSESDLERYFVKFGQGYKSMSPALRSLEAEILNGRVAHGAHPVLKMCMANAVVQSDPAGNRKLAKDRSAGRIDGAVALAMMVGVADADAGDGYDVRAMVG